MSYLLIKGIDIWCGDEGSTEVVGLPAAIEAAKGHINSDPAKVALIIDLGEDKFGVWFKNLRETNPTNLDSKHEDCVFWGFCLMFCEDVIFVILLGYCFGFCYEI